jgi:uncharacterized protein (TIGR03437 family)
VKNFKIPRDSLPLWSESPSRLTFTMPPGRRPGTAWVYMTDSRGIDSNAQTLTLACADCPRLTGSCAVVNAANPTTIISPGSTVTINGAGFSPTGNTVALEIPQPGQVTASRILPRENILSESPFQITAKLPDDLPITYQANLYVVNDHGLQTGDNIIGISEPCQDCSSKFRPCQALVNEGGGGFLPGAITTAHGRFSTSGNKVMIEQVDQGNVIHQYTLSDGSPQWSEDGAVIRFTLPASLFAGHATLYIVDAQGRETSARELVINSAPLRDVSAANYRGPNLTAESIAAAFGQSLATTVQAATTVPLPTELGGTRVVVKDALGVERAAPLFFVSPAQINYQVPLGTQLGWASVTIYNGAGASFTDPVHIVSVSPGVFSADSSGHGVAAALVLRFKADGTYTYEPVAAYDQTQGRFISVPIDVGAPADQVYLTLFGTGLRGRSSTSAVSASIGGTSLEVTYAGPQGSLIGVDQVNLRLPGNLAGKGEAELSVSVDGLAANSVNVRIH